MSMRRALLVVIGLVLAVAALWAWSRRDAPAPVPSASVAEAMSAPADAAYLRAEAPRDFAFPADHGPHPGFRTEWWYWTGNLGAADGRRFGYQFTVFRVALAPPPDPSRESAWAARDAYFAHLAVTDAAGRRFVAHHDTARGAVGLAGAQADPFRVWIGGWSAEGWGPTALRAHSDEAPAVALDLRLMPGKGAVLNGEAGLSRKGGGASYYYSFTRMPTSGTLTIGGEAIAVEGLSWMDREWSTSALTPQQVGWDWFALQLDDGRELMLYRMRLRDGGLDPASSGTLVEADGSYQHLDSAAFAVEPGATWSSPRGGTYPAAWRVRVPAAAIDVEVRPLIAAQELDVGFRYWEGAVEVRLPGDAAGAVLGRGYVELTGYVDGSFGRDADP